MEQTALEVKQTEMRMNGGHPIRRVLETPTKRKRYQRGCVALKKRADGRGTWVFRYSRDGIHHSVRIGTTEQFPTKAIAERQVSHLVQLINSPAEVAQIQRLASSYKQKAWQKHTCTPDEYERMHVEQRGGCAICGRTDDRLQVDHDHDTGITRSLLCGSCNKGLGHFRDNPHLVRLAAFYLEKHGCGVRR